MMYYLRHHRGFYVVMVIECLLAPREMGGDAGWVCGWRRRRGGVLVSGRRGLLS